MNIAHTIHCWLNGLNRNQGLPDFQPAFLPLTAEEVSAVTHNAVAYSPILDRCDPSATPMIYGMPVHETYFAEEQRARQLEVPFLHLEEHETFSPSFTYRMDEKHLRHDLTTRICAETATLRLHFEWDCWAGVKRFLHITRWFPIRKRLVMIDGRVLYPYLKVGLPHNRHSVQFKTVGIS